MSARVVNALRQRRVVHYADIANDHDAHLVKMGWVYGLNFAPAIRILTKRRLIPALQSMLPADARIDGLLRQIEADIQNHPANTGRPDREAKQATAAAGRH